MATTPPSLGQKALVEGVGAFILTFIGAGSIIATQGSQLIVIALAHGIALAIAVSAAMNISGGHINPAVTIGMLVTKRISLPHSIVYIISQLIGATIGGALLYGTLPTDLGKQVIWGIPQLVSTTQAQGIFLEAVMTFILLFAVFGTAVDSRAPKIGGFGIGLAIAIDIMMGGPFTGAAMNPSRAIGPLIAAFATGTVPTNYPWYVWWIGPILGAVVASLIYENAILQKH